ncbi:hypothetical protein [Actinomadura sp. WMMB 499]|uniref:hypothetical protein n=1 Tax=Actinomadura sp. WMMB 499 TaxID=1219491 RepID=UPI001245EFF4|nr:hypothetical protein [Actinomadura sp. WMMB 499]QFG20163.1 hypothetical protein F7P10_02225 [Actinomadura sp. WMMB 499]
MKGKTSVRPEAGGDEPAVYEYGLTFTAAKEAAGKKPPEKETEKETEDGPAGGGDAAARRRLAPGLNGRRPPRVPPAVLAASFGRGEDDDEAESGNEGEGEAASEKPDTAKRPRKRVRGIGARGRTPGPRSRLALRIVPAAALVAVSAALGVVWQDRNDLASAADGRRDLAGAAGKVASVFFNWDYQHMDESFAAKYPLLTEQAADAIRPTASTLISYFTKNKVSSQAHISGIYPGEVKDGAANVLVVINTKVTTAETVQSNDGATVALSMERASGRWLAGNITLLSPGAESVTDENGKPLEGAQGEGGGAGAGGAGLPGGLPSTGGP